MHDDEPIVDDSSLEDFFVKWLEAHEADDELTAEDWARNNVPASHREPLLDLIHTSDRFLSRRNR